MDAVIEVVAMGAQAQLVALRITVTKAVQKVVVLVSTVTTSILRAITSQGRTSRSAVAPDNTLYEGGTAAA
jgi:hypothetical protein